MLIDKPVSFAEAVNMLRSKNLLPTNAKTADLDRIDADIRERHFFSAQVARADILREARKRIDKMVDPAGLAAGEYMDDARFREEMRDVLSAVGYRPDPGKEGTLEDLYSERRLNVMGQTNTRMSQGYGQFVQSQDPAVLDAFPAQELYRLERRQIPRDWFSRWRAAGGTTYQGRMIALKNDPIWTAISRFGNPYPPYDFNSGMWTKSVDRETAVRAGLIDFDTQIQPDPRSLNDGLQVPVDDMPDDIKQRLLSTFEGRARIEENALLLVPAKQALSTLVANAARVSSDVPSRVNFAPITAANADQLSSATAMTSSALVVDSNTVAAATAAGIPAAAIEDLAQSQLRWDTAEIVGDQIVTQSGNVRAIYVQDGGRLVLRSMEVL